MVSERSFPFMRCSDTSISTLGSDNEPPSLFLLGSKLSLLLLLLDYNCVVGDLKAVNCRTQINFVVLSNLW